MRSRYPRTPKVSILNSSTLVFYVRITYNVHIVIKVRKTEITADSALFGSLSPVQTYIDNAVGVRYKISSTTLSLLPLTSPNKGCGVVGEGHWGPSKRVNLIAFGIRGTDIAISVTPPHQKTTIGLICVGL